MKKGTKIFGGFIVVTLSAILIIAAIIAAVFYNEVVIPEPETQALAAGEIYKQGTYYGRSTYGTNVNTASAFVSAINSGSNINLTEDISLTGDNAFFHSGTYTGQIFGNGYTISINKNWTSNANYEKKSNGSSWGGIVGILGSGGAIYDLNVVMTNHVTYASQGAAAIYVGGIVGSLSGGTIDNCTFTLSGSNSRLAALAWSGGSGFYPASGGIAGHVTGGRISNCTVTNEGWIEGGVGSLSGGNLNVGSDDIGASGLVTGTIYASGNFTIDNIVVRGSGNVKNSFYASALGMLWGTSETVSMTNFYNAFTGTYTCDNSGGSAQFVHNSGGGSSSITNYYYVESVAGPTNGTAYAVTNIAARIILNNNQAGRDVYFDPSTGTDYANSISISYSNQTAPAAGVNRIWYVYGAGGTGSTPIASTNVITGGTTVTFIGLPSAVSAWNSSTSGGYFTSAIDYMDILQMDDLTEYEHGYVSADTTTSGTEAISTGTQFEKIFRPNGTLIEAGTYYLTEDIVITGFTGKKFGGTLDGNGHTIFITDTHTGMTGPHIGGLVGTLSGTIKNVRVVLMLPNNTQVTCTNGKDGDDFVIGFGGVVGKINGGTVENVNVVIPSGYTFSAGWSGSGSDVGVGGIAGSMIGSGTVTNCTVQVDGDIRASSGWPFASGIVGATGKEQNYSNYPFKFTNIILKGIGTIGGTTGSGNDTQPTFAAAITITPPITGNTISIDGFIYNMTGENGPTWGSGGGAGSGYGKVSSWGYVCQNNDNGRPTAGVGLSAVGKISYSNIYDMGSLMYDTVAETGFTSGGDLIWYDTTNHDGNVYYNMTRTAEIKSTVAESTIPVTPYFPTSYKEGEDGNLVVDTDNLVLVAGDGTVTVPDLRYTNNAGTAYNSTADGNYKVVTVAKTNIDTATVTLEEPIIQATPIDDLNQWENGYVASPRTGNVSTAADLTTAIEENRDIILSKDIRDFTGFAHTETYTGTLDGNGHTIYIVRSGGANGENVGGLFSTLTGTVKNLRLVITTGINLSNTKYLGGIAGALDENAVVENVFVTIPAGVNLVTTRSGNDVGGVGGIAGGLINGSGKTVYINNTTVELQGTLKATAYWTFVGGFMGHLNGESDKSKGAINYTNTTFKGSGLLDGVANAGEGVHTAALGIVGGNVSAVYVDGVINSFNGTLSSGRSAYAIIVRNSQDTNISVSVKNIYTFGTVTTYDGSMDYGKPVSPSNGTKDISTEVSGASTPVTPYFPASSGSGNLVLVAGNGKDSFTTPVGYNNGTKFFVSEAVAVTVEEESITYQVVTVAKENVTTDPVSLEIAAVNDPVIATPSEDLVYSGQSGIEVTVNTLKYGAYVLQPGVDYDYTINIAAVDETGSVADGKPVNAGRYTLTVTLLKDYRFADKTQIKSLEFEIDRKAVTVVTVTAEDRQYDGTTNVTLSGGALTGVVSGDEDYVTANLGTGTADQAGVGTNIPVTVNVTLEGDRAANYVLQSQPTVTVNITKKELGFTTAETKSFPFADTKGTAITDQNLTSGDTYSVNVTGFVESDPEEAKAYTLTVADVADSSYITERTAVGDGSKFLKVGTYTVTLSPASGNYTFGSNETFTFYVTQNESANTWITEYARGGWTYYSNPTAVTEPVARFGSPAITYSNGSAGFSNTTAQGTYKVNVSVAETDNYGALTKEYSFTVSALDVTLALSAADTTYDGQAYDASNIIITLTATVNDKETTYTSADNSSDVSTLLGSYGWQHSVDGATETKEGLPTGAGTYTISIIDYDGNGNVKVSGTSGDAAVIAKAQVIFRATIKGDAKLVYGTVPTDFNSLVNVTAIGGINLSDEGWSFTVTPSVENGEYTAKTHAGKTVILTVTITMNDPNHSAVQPTEQPSLVIQKAVIGDITVSNFDSKVTIDNVEYDGFVYGQAKELAFSGIPADLTVDPEYTYAKQDGKQIENFDILTADSGIYTVTVSITDDDNYNNKTEAIVFAIAKADRSVTVTIDGWTYGKTANKPDIDGIEESAIASVTYTGTTNAGDEYNSEEVPTIVPTEAGKYTVTVSWDETTNYTAGSVESAEFIIKRATGFANVKVNNEDYTGKVTSYYTGEEQSFEVTVVGHEGGSITIGEVGGASAIYTFKNAVTQNIQIKVSESDNFDEANAVAVITVLPAEIESVSLGIKQFTFGKITAETAVKAETYGDLTIGFAGKGDGTPAFTYSLSYNNTESDNDVTYISVGTYTLTMKLTGDNAKNFKFANGSDNITAEIKIVKGENTWTDTSKINSFMFGLKGEEVKGKAAFGNARIKIDYYFGNVIGQTDREEDAVTFDFIDATAMKAGTYTAVVSVPGNGNYDEIFYEYTFDVQKHALKISNLTISGIDSGSAADGYTVTYSQEMALSATVDVGPADGYEGTLTTLFGGGYGFAFEYKADGNDVWTDGLPESAGKYTVRFKGMELAEGYNIDNFEFEFVSVPSVPVPSVKLTIDPAVIEVTAGIPENAVVYGMTAEEIRSRITLKPEVGVTLGEVKVTYDNGTAYDNTVDAGTELTISVSVNAENDNYIAEFAGGATSKLLTATVQKATLNVSAQNSSKLSADFDPDKFEKSDKYAAITAKWNGKVVSASEYFDVTLTGYEGDVAASEGWTVQELFQNKESGTYTFTVTLKADFADNFVADPETVTYELTLALGEANLTITMDDDPVYGTSVMPVFKVTVGEDDISAAVGRFIKVHYEGIGGTQYDSHISPSDVGSYKLTASIVGHPDYYAKPCEIEFTITARSVSFVTDIDGVSVEYYRNTEISSDRFIEKFGGYFKLAEGSSFAYAENFADVFNITVASGGSAVDSVYGAGEYTVTVELFNDNYVLVGDAPKMTYTVEQAVLTIEVAIDDGVYGKTGTPYIAKLTLKGTDETFDAEAIAAWSDTNEPELYAVLKGIGFTYSGWANDGSEVDGSPSYPESAGKYTVSAAYEAGGNYSNANDSAGFDVARADLTDFTVKVSDFYYNGLHIAGGTPVMTGGNPQLEGEGLSETVSYFVLTGAGYKPADFATDVGHYKIVRYSPPSDNYNEADAECEFTVSPAVVSVDSYTTSYKFGSVTEELKDEYAYVISLNASVSANYADKITYSTELIGDYGSEQGYLNVGSYTLKIVLTNGNYAFTEGAGEIAIEIVPSENKFVSVKKRAGWIYGNEPADINVSVAYGSANIVTYDSEENVVELSAATYAGSYYDVVTVPASEFGNYESIEYAGDTSFVIEKAEFVWSWNFLPDEIVYGDSLDNAFEINTPELIVESDLGYFAFNIYAYYIVDGDIVPYTVTTDANNEITLSAECVWTYDAPEGVKNSYIISTENADPIKKTVQRKPIVITASNTTAVYGSAYIPTGDAADYFGALFTYNGEPVTELAALGSTAEFTVAGDGVAEDRLNVGNYTVTLQLSGNHTVTGAEGDAVAGADAVTVNYTVAPKELHVSEAVRNTVLEFGDIALADLNSPEAVIKLIGGVDRMFDGLEFGDVLSESDLILKAADDYSDLVSDGYLSVADVPYLVSVALSDGIENYVAPSAGFGYVGFVVEKAANRIGRYSVSGWTYLDERAEYIPSKLPNADFGTVEYAFFAPDGSEMTMDKFNSETPAGTYSFRFSVQGTDNYDSAVLTGEFVVGKLFVYAYLNAPDSVYDGNEYDELTYTLSEDVSDHVGTPVFEYSENGYGFVKGLPSDAGSYTVRIAEYSDSENIDIVCENAYFDIAPAPMYFTVKGVANAAIEYMTDVSDIDFGSLIDSVVPDSDIGGFDFTVSLITDKGAAYRPGLYAGTELRARVEIKVESGNYYAVVETQIDALPVVSIVKRSLEMEFVLGDETLTEGSEANVKEGNGSLVIYAITAYMSENDIQYYDYEILVDGEKYSRDFYWAPGEHTVQVMLGGNHEGSSEFTVFIEEDPTLRVSEPYVPQTEFGKFLDSINFTWASAVSIAFGVAVSVLVILFFGLRRAKRK